jgi:hypothetical protein
MAESSLARSFELYELQIMRRSCSSPDNIVRSGLSEHQPRRISLHVPGIYMYKIGNNFASYENYLDSLSSLNGDRTCFIFFFEINKMCGFPVLIVC